MDSSRGEGGRRRTCSYASDLTAFGHGNCKEPRWRRKAHLPGFFGSLISNLDSFRHHEELTDLTLVVEKCKRIPVHRCILAAASPFFRSMYSSGMMESYRNEVELKDVNYEEVKLVVNFIYTGGAPMLNRDNVGDVLRVADLFLIQELKLLCIDFMSKNMITLRDVISTFGLAYSHCLEQLQNHAADFISTNMEELLQSPHFLEAEADDVAAFIRSDHIVFYSEDAAFEGLLRWITHRLDERLQYLEDLLPCVRLTLVSNNFLTEHILNNKIIRENENAMDLVKETLKCHMPVSWKGDKRQAFRRVESCRLGAMMSQNPRKGPSVQCSIVLGKSPSGDKTKVACYVPVDNRWYDFEEASFRVDIPPSTIYFKGGLYVLGGELGDQVFRLALDEALPKWREIAKLNQTRATGCCVLYHKNELYVIGGSSSKRKKKSRQRKTIEKYDEANDKWILCEPLPHPCYRCDVVHLASDDVLLRTYEFSREGKSEDKVHYYHGPNIAKIREENDLRLVEELTRISGPPPEQLDVDLIKTVNGTSLEISYGHRRDIAPPPVHIHSTSAICNALVVRRAIQRSTE